MIRKQRGITLIALIITIIVLLILAGVSISLVVGDNGVLTQSQNAKKKTEEANAIEEISMAWSSIYTDYLVDSSANPNIQKNGYFTLTNFQKYMNGNGSITAAVYNSDGTVSINYQRNSEVTENYVIDSNGNVTRKGIYGTEIDLGSSILAKKWQYFYDDGDNIYLIYADYLETAKIQTQGTIEKN